MNIIKYVLKFEEHTYNLENKMNIYYSIRTIINYNFSEKFYNIKMHMC